MPLRLPAAVAVDQLRQVGCLLGVPRDEFVLEELLGCWPLCSHSRQVDSFCEDIVDSLDKKGSESQSSKSEGSAWIRTGRIFVIKFTSLPSFQLTQAGCNENVRIKADTRYRKSVQASPVWK